MPSKVGKYRRLLDKEFLYSVRRFQQRVAGVKLKIGAPIQLDCKMRQGINYDIGTATKGKGSTSRNVFDPDIVHKEIKIIKHDLHCNSIRIYGQDVDRGT